MKKLAIILILVIILSAGGFVFTQLSNQEEETQDYPEFSLVVHNEVKDVLNPYTEILITSSGSVTLIEGAASNLRETEKEGHFILRVNEIPNGNTSREFIFEDQYGQSTTKEIRFNRLSGGLPPGYLSIDGWKDANYILEPSIHSLVDRDNRLLEDYEAQDVLDLNKEFGIYTLNEAALIREAAVEINRLWNDLGEETGDYVTIVSGYRSWITQFKLYSGYITAYGQEETDTFSARPGHSEHQLGTTLDFTNAEVDYKLVEEFGDTKAGKWLVENSYKYGFVPSYPKKDQSQTGFYEPWQYRYVGVEEAKEIHESGISLYEWLEGINNSK